MGITVFTDGSVPSFTEHEQNSCSFQLCYSLIDRTVPSSTREDTVVAYARTKKVNEKDTKTFSLCFVSRNGNSNPKKYTYKCVDHSRRCRIKGDMTKCVR